MIRAALVAVAVVATVVFRAGAARANADVQLDVEPLNPQVGEAIRIRYTVSIRNETGAQPTPLDFGNLELISGDPQPPSMPMMFGGGFAMTMETATDYVVRAPAAGRYTISNARVVDARTGRVIAQHPPVTLVVGGASAAFGADAGIEPDAFVPPAPPPDPDMPPTGDLSGAEYNPNAFLRVAVDTPNPYVGQQVILRLWLYAPSAQTSCELTREPTMAGFWNELLTPPSRECATRWFTANLGGRYMAVGLVRKIALFPSQAGRLTIGAAESSVETVTGGFFRSVARLDARSPDLQIEVREPPAPGRPADYVVGTVGPVNLTATADRTDFAVGETVTLTLRAVSEGSLETAHPAIPEHVDGLRIRTGETRATHDLSSGRVQSILETEVLIAAERAGQFDLGEVSLAYWDPQREQYGVARASLPLLVARGAALPAPGTEHQTNPEMELLPLREHPALRGYRTWIRSARGAVVLIAFPPVALACVGLGRLALRRIARRRRERADERKEDPLALMREARRIGTSDPRASISLAGRALDKALARVRSDLDGGEASLPDEAREAVRAARVAADEARFAGAQADPNAVFGPVERAVRAIVGAL